MACSILNRDGYVLSGVTTVQPIASDGMPVGDRHVLVTPVFGAEGIRGADDIGVYEPQPCQNRWDQLDRDPLQHLSDPRVPRLCCCHRGVLQSRLFCSLSTIRRWEFTGAGPDGVGRSIHEFCRPVTIIVLVSGRCQQHQYAN